MCKVWIKISAFLVEFGRVNSSIQGDYKIRVNSKISIQSILAEEIEDNVFHSIPELRKFK